MKYAILDQECHLQQNAYYVLNLLAQVSLMSDGCS